MLISEEKIKLMVEKAFPGAKVKVRDMTGTQDHYELQVVSESFTGKNQVARHRLVYSSLGAFVGAEIHALSLKTLTPEEEK